MSVTALPVTASLATAPAVLGSIAPIFSTRPMTLNFARSSPMEFRQICPTVTTSQNEITNLAAHVRSLAKLPGEILAGNAERGGAIYARSGCSSCHIRNGQGIGYGPELTAIGDRRSSAFLKGVVENPASELPEGFLLVTAVTMSGKTVTGIRINEDTFTIQIKDNGGKLYSLRKKNLKRLARQKGKTSMPSYLFSPSDLQDLVAFLGSSRQSP